MTKGDWGSCKALFSIEIDGVWISGFKIIETNGELWIGNPSRKTNDGEYKDIVGMTKEKKEELKKIAISYYGKLSDSIEDFNNNYRENYDK